MKVLIGMERSGAVRRQARLLGHDAWSCDILPATDSQEFHLQQDVLSVIWRAWDIVILHPPCTYLCRSGIHHNVRSRARSAKTKKAVEFVIELWRYSSHVPMVCLENPIGVLSSQWRKPDQIIHPHQFGDDASKATALWLRGLPKLLPTEHVPPRIVNGLPRWANQTDSGQNRVGPGNGRDFKRAKTYDGIARAMAWQWMGMA